MMRLCTTFPSFYRLAALLALWALFVPLATMLVHHPRTAMPMSTAMCDMETEKSSPPKHDTGTPQKIPTCPICQGLHSLSGGFVPPDSVAFISPILLVVTYVLNGPAYLIVFTLLPQGRPRAPPHRA